jgi:hypothetical protein
MFISKLKRTFYTNPAANQVNQQKVPRSFQNRTGYFWTAGKKAHGFLIGIGAAARKRCLVPPAQTAKRTLDTKNCPAQPQALRGHMP